MSQSNTEKCEPNLTPLLDLVLQLVMFFMLVTNFVMEQTSAEITLPSANAAKSLDKGANEIIFLNINAKGQVLLTGDEPLDNPVQVEGYLKRLAAIEMKKTGKDKPLGTLILRIDEKTPFEKSYPIMRACRQANYTKVELRAIRGED